MSKTSRKMCGHFFSTGLVPSPPSLGEGGARPGGEGLCGPRWFIFARGLACSLPRPPLPPPPSLFSVPPRRPGGWASPTSWMAAGPGGAWPMVTLQRGLERPALHSNMSENFKGQHRLGLLARPRPRHCGWDSPPPPPPGPPSPTSGCGEHGAVGSQGALPGPGPLAAWLTPWTEGGSAARGPEVADTRGRAEEATQAGAWPRQGRGQGTASWPRAARSRLEAVAQSGLAPLEPCVPGRPLGPPPPAPSWPRKGSSGLPGGSDPRLHRPLLPQALRSVSERPAGPRPGPLFGGSEKPPHVPQDQGWPERASSSERMKREQHLVTAGAGLPQALGPR